MIDVTVRANTKAATAAVLLNSRDIARATARALNKTAAQVRTGASREIRAAGYNLKAGTIRKTLSTTRATPARLIAALTATGRPIPLINYGARQTTKGVTVRVKNGSKTLRHAFIATMASAHIGVFERVGTGHKRVTKNGRAHWSGLPIRELYGPSIPDALGNAAVQKTMGQLIEDRYPTILAHEFAWISTHS
ncbi:hypothetical protein WJ58_28880 [Burkholderia ubonensis]|uniref:phage tail protein n=1 Tax=Burkholderia ubonensis TaxID=101571 RepID=UPI00075CB82C|nr:phage tail protein [Burkholderia ubonensis]KVM47118.1 hypothetical protein WJ58_28880 [Burkholderia ubonensis]